MHWNLINPSDRIEFQSDTFEDAVAAVVAVGSGAYGADRLDDPKSEGVPIMLFGSAETYLARFGGIEVFLEYELNSRAVHVADVLDSFCGPSGNVTSPNDICARARRIATTLRKKSASAGTEAESEGL